MEDFSYLRSRLEIKSFSDLQDNMEEQEVKGRKVAIDIVKANIFAVVIMVVAAIVFLVPFFWKSISFGVMWKLLTPYCHCDEPMHIPGYMMGAMMPCVILGVIPAIAALFIGSLPMLAWGIFFIAAAAGDIGMTWLLTKENPWSMVLDYPSEAGFYIID